MSLLQILLCLGFGESTVLFESHATSNFILSNVSVQLLGLKTLSEALSHYPFLLKSLGFENFVMKILVFACDEHSDLKSLF